MSRSRLAKPVSIVLALALALALAGDCRGQKPTHTFEFTPAGVQRLRGSIRGAGQLLGPPFPPAMVFHSREDRVVVSRSIRNLELPTKAISVEAWVMLDAPRPWGGILSAMQDNGNFEKGILLGYRGSRFCFAVAGQGSDDGDGKLTYLTGSSAFVPGRFQHVVGVYDGAETRLYVDGKREATSDAQKGPILYPRRAVVELGAYHDDDEDFPFVGLLGMVRIWDGALDDRAVQREFAARANRFAMPATPHPRTWRLTATATGLHGSSATSGGATTAVPVTRPAPNRPIRFDTSSGVPSLRLASDAKDRAEAAFVAATGDLPKRALSIEATFWLSGDRRRQTIAATDAMQLAILDGKLQARVGQTIATVSDPITSYRWHHATATWDGSLLRLYVDGVSRSFGRTATNSAAHGPELRIAAGMQGRLHEITLTGAVLAAAEVRRRCAAKQALFPQPLQLEIGPVARFTSPTSAQITWLGPARARSTWVDVMSTNGGLRRVPVRQENGRDVADIKGMRPGVSFDYRILVESEDGKQRASDTFRLDTEFNYSSNWKGTKTALRPLPVAPELSAVLAKIPTKKGYAVVLGSHTACVERLAAATELQIVVVEPDREKVRSLRREFAVKGLYGRQVTVLHSDFATIPLGSDLANAVVVATDIEVAAKELDRICRPHGGVVLDLEGRVLLSKGAKRDAGDWTHQYGGSSNTAASDDELVGGPLELQWFGKPGPRPMMDRGARSPAPLATRGRLFIHGDRRLFGMDAYNGTMLWTLEIPALRRTNVPRDCSNITAHGDDLFVAVRDRLWRVASQTGQVAKTYQIPTALRAADDPAWGFVHATDNAVLGTATRVAATFRGAEGEWYDKPGVDSEDVLGSALFSLDKSTEQPRWTYQRGVIIHPTITIGTGTIYFVEDRSPSAASIAKGRLVDQTGTDQYLVALDVATGNQVWERKYDFRKFHQAFYLSLSDGVLVAVGTSGKYHVHGFDASTGRPMWQHSHGWKRDHHGGGLQHPVIIDGVVYVEFKAIDLHKGNVVREDLPDRRGCGTMSGSGKSIFFRHYDHTMWDLETNVRTTLPGIRSGCWLSLIPAGGLLLAPESSSGCSCANPIQTSVAYRPKAAPQMR